MTWLTIAGMTAITFFNRYAFFAETIRYQPGDKTKRLLSYSSYAVLTAIWTPILFSVSVEDGFSHAGVDYLVAAVLAAVLAYLRIRTIIVVLISTSVFFAIRFL